MKARDGTDEPVMKDDCHIGADDCFPSIEAVHDSVTSHDLENNALPMVLVLAKRLQWKQRRACEAPTAHSWALVQPRIYSFQAMCFPVRRRSFVASN